MGAEAITRAPRVTWHWGHWARGAGRTEGPGAGCCAEGPLLDGSEGHWAVSSASGVVRKQVALGGSDGGEGEGP